jgi:ion channel-forming bestrophin family protein
VRLSVRKVEAKDESREELALNLTPTEMDKLKAVKKNFPVLIRKWIGDSMVEFKAQLLFDRATDFMDGNIQDMMAAWMGMQKLATTPMPFPYVQMLYSLLYGWMWTCGIPLANYYGWVSIIAVVLLGYTLFGINAIGQELEDPLGEEDNDLEIEFFEKAANSAAKLMLGDIPLAGKPRWRGARYGDFCERPEV